MTANVDLIAHTLNNISEQAIVLHGIGDRKICPGGRVAQVVAYFEGDDITVDVSIEGNPRNPNPAPSAHENMEIRGLVKTIKGSAKALFEETTKVPLLKHPKAFISISVIKQSRTRKQVIFKLDGYRMNKKPLAPATIAERIPGILNQMARMDPKFLDSTFRKFTVNGEFEVFAPTPEAAIWKVDSRAPGYLRTVESLTETLDHSAALKSVRAGAHVIQSTRFL